MLKQRPNNDVIHSPQYTTGIKNKINLILFFQTQVLLCRKKNFFCPFFLRLEKKKQFLEIKIQFFSPFEINVLFILKFFFILCLENNSQRVYDSCEILDMPIKIFCF